MKATALVATLASLFFVSAHATAQKRIAFLGDSITHGFTANHASYRWPLWDLLSNHCVNFVGTRIGSSNGNASDPIGAVPLGNPLPRFDQDHDGVSGQLTLGVLQTVLTSLPPAEMYVVQVGANDVARGWSSTPTGQAIPVPPSAIFSVLFTIVDTIRTSRGSPVFVCTLTHADMTMWPTNLNPNFNQDVDRLNSLILAPGALPAGTTIAQPHGSFDPTIHTTDGIHPNVTGEAIYAQAIAIAIASILPATPSGACSKQFGMGCKYTEAGSTRAPKLRQSGPAPTPGAPIAFELEDLPTNAVGSVLLANLTDAPGVALPATLALGCSTLVGLPADVMLTTTPGPTPGTASVPWMLPAGSTWLGTKIYLQGLAVGGGYNALDALNTNALVVTIGL